MMTRREHRIVVGVDGSDISRGALGWAIRQARLTGASVDAVIAWRYPATYGWAPYADGSFDLEGDAKEALTGALAQASVAEPEVPVHPAVCEGHAAEVLLRAAREADLLVVGSRGHGGLTSALLGSVSLQCALHAPCPVLVFRPGTPVPRGGGQREVDESVRTGDRDERELRTGNRPGDRGRR